jgi:geranylgeranyl pyrophosphate synthase
MLDLERLSREKAGLIDREIEKVFPKAGIKNLDDAVWYHLGTGGKRLRPLLAILTCEALGGSVRKITPFAAACEILHNWFLVHDDIEDGDKVRRDQPTVWMKFGIPHAINVGDYMAQKVYQLILLSRERGVSEDKVLRLLDAMITTSIRTAEGQTMDINLRQNNSPTEKEYMEMVMGKTGHYLTVTMVGAAIVADREEITPRLIDFGKSIGPAFQIADDILDLTEGKGRGEIGRDIKEGKRSILVIHCLSNCSHEERQKLLHILNKSPEETTADDVNYAKKLFEHYGSINYARRRAEELKQEAMKSIKKTPEELHEILEFFADYLINRKK